MPMLIIWQSSVGDKIHYLTDSLKPGRETVYMRFHVVNNMGNPQVTKLLPIPLPTVPLPIKPVGFLVKMSPKNMFLGLFESSQVWLSRPIPISFTRRGLHTPVIH